MMPADKRVMNSVVSLFCAAALYTHAPSCDNALLKVEVLAAMIIAVDFVGCLATFASDDPYSVTPYGVSNDEDQL